VTRHPRLIVAVIVAGAALGTASIGSAVGQRIDHAAAVDRQALRVDPPVIDGLTPEQRAAWGVVVAVNLERRQRNLPDLLWNDQVAAAALAHSTDIAARRQLDPLGADGSTASERLRAAGFDWIDWGEAIAFGYVDPESLVAAWMASDAHRRFLIGDYRYIGVAAVATSDGLPYWTLVVAT
jgi:uncharacterized protein YkwD